MGECPYCGSKGGRGRSFEEFLHRLPSSDRERFIASVQKKQRFADPERRQIGTVTFEDGSKSPAFKVIPRGRRT